MSKFTEKMYTAANAVVSGANFVVAGPFSIEEFDHIGIIIENCHTVSGVFSINANGGNISAALIEKGFLGNTQTVIGGGASLAQAYNLQGGFWEKLTITCCATAALGASHVRIYFTGRKSD